MNVRGAVLWGFVSTVFLTGIMAGTQALRLTRMNIPYMLGTMLTGDRNRAPFVGMLAHIVNGWMFAAVYASAFESWRGAGWWRGAAIGVVHGLAVLLFGMRVLPSVHPRMASEDEGPRPTRQLEPPGWLALHYGTQTPVSVMVAHVVYGAILGQFYRVRAVGGRRWWG